MASIRDLKKDVNYVLGDIIDAVLLWELSTGNQKSAQGKGLVEEILGTYDAYMSKISNRDVENRGAHLKAVRSDFEKDATALIEKLNQLN